MQPATFTLGDLELILDGLKCLKLYRFNRLLKAARKRNDSKAAADYTAAMIETMNLYHAIRKRYDDAIADGEVKTRRLIDTH